jgi:glycogen(starch) synthase
MTPPAYSNANLVVALSPYMETLAIRGGAKPERVSLIPNGIEPADIGLDSGVPLLPRVATGRLELLYVGRLSVEKGVDVLIEAAALLRARGISFHLRIAGSGVQERGLREQVAYLQLNDIVEFVGPRPRKELGALYQSADALCVPSRSEPFGVVILEAMAAGVAVVGADTGGIPCMIDHGLNGLLCKPEDPDGFADALERFASEFGLAGRMGAAGQQRAASEFGWVTVGKLLSEAVVSVMENSSGY